MKEESFFVARRECGQGDFSDKDHILTHVHIRDLAERRIVFDSLEMMRKWFRIDAHQVEMIEKNGFECRVAWSTAENEVFFFATATPFVVANAAVVVPFVDAPLNGFVWIRSQYTHSDRTRAMADFSQSENLQAEFAKNLAEPDLEPLRENVKVVYQRLEDFMWRSSESGQFTTFTLLLWKNSDITHRANFEQLIDFIVYKTRKYIDVAKSKHAIARMYWLLYKVLIVPSFYHNEFPLWFDKLIDEYSKREPSKLTNRTLELINRVDLYNFNDVLFCKDFAVAEPPEDKLIDYNMRADRLFALTGEDFCVAKDFRKEFFGEKRKGKVKK